MEKIMEQQNKMTAEDALKILDEATNSVKTDRRGHSLILQALDALKEKLLLNKEKDKET
jgi:hypothetical protein